MNGSTVASLSLPAGRYFIIGRVLVGDTSHFPGGSKTAPSYYADCTLAAGDDSDYNQVRGLNGGGLSGNVTPATMMVIHQFDAPGTATLRCSTGIQEPSVWANARIAAVQVKSTVVKPPIGGTATTPGVSGP